MDTLTKAERSERMALVRAKDTRPEIQIRRIVYSLGFRYRLHVSALPGKPDLVFSRRRKVIFVHGCFWHRHPRCALARLPKSKRAFWIPKLTENRSRDLRTARRLRNRGWKILTLWECQVKKDVGQIEKKIRRFLSDE